MNASVSFGQWLKQRRKALELTREALAQRIGCAVVTLNKIEADERRPSHQLAELLAEHLNIPLDERPAFIRFARAKEGKDSAFENPLFYSPTNLPVQPNLLIGRTADVAALRKQLLQPQTRLLTLTGPPGIGKTRLALQLAAEVREDFPDGVFLVSLAPVTDTNLVLTTCASTLGAPAGGPKTPLERLKAFLREKQILLVLDNFEQVLAAAAQIADLLAACPRLKLLVTSRAPLRIRPERQFPVMPLALPDLIHLPDADSVSQYSAVALFLERAQAVKPEFALTEANAPSVSAICTRLDGLPLAIELISARIKLLHPAALLERLSGGLMLRSDGPRDLEPRHRTLNEAIEWSYQLLDLEEQTLFRRLGVFVGGWTLEAAEAVCAENLSLNIIDGLASLLDKSLIKQEATPNESSRFTMLETIREFALEQLNTHYESEQVRQRHAEFFVKLAEPSASGDIWVLYWQLEYPNLRGALVWSRTEESGETELRLAVGLRNFWRINALLSEGMSWLTEAAARTKDLSSPTLRGFRGLALDALSVYNQWLDNLDTAQTYSEEAIAILRDLGDSAGIAEALSHYGMGFVLRGADPERAAEALKEGIALYRELGDVGGVATCLFFLAHVAYYMLADKQQARVLWQESLEEARAVSYPWVIANNLMSLAMTSMDQGDYEQAYAQLRESAHLFQQMGETWGTIHLLELFARLAVEQPSEDGQSLRLQAARICGVVERVREAIGAPMMSFLRPSHDQTLATLGAELDEAVLVAAWTEGRAMTLNEAVAYALTGLYTAGEAEASSE